MIGIKGLISGKPYRSSFRAIRNSEVVMFQVSKEQLAELIASRPKVNFLFLIFCFSVCLKTNTNTKQS